MSEECRKAFEAWFEKEDGGRQALSFCDGSYEFIRTQWAWLAWSARTQSVEGLVEALEEIEKPRHGLDSTETETERAEYWARWALKYRDIARAALASYRNPVTPAKGG